MWLRSPRMKAPRVLSFLLYSSPFDHNNEEPRNPNTLCLCCPFSPLLRSTTHLSLAEQSSLSSADSPRSGHIGLRLRLDPPLRTQASPYLALQIERRSSEAPVSISLPVPCPRSFPSFINLPPSSFLPPPPTSCFFFSPQSPSLRNPSPLAFPRLQLTTTLLTMRRSSSSSIATVATNQTKFFLLLPFPPSSPLRGAPITSYQRNDPHRQLIFLRSSNV